MFDREVWVQRRVQSSIPYETSTQTVRFSVGLPMSAPILLIVTKAGVGQGLAFSKKISASRRDAFRTCETSRRERSITTLNRLCRPDTMV